MKAHAIPFPQGSAALASPARGARPPAPAAQGGPGIAARERGYRVIRGFFSGAYLNQVDAKHRLSVPAPIRETVEARSGAKTVVLAPAEHAPCLAGYDVSYLETLQQQIEVRFANDFGQARANLSRAIFAAADTINYDDTGRIILNPILRDLASLEGPALFLGAGEYFELWSPSLFLATEAIDPRLKRIVAALVAAKGG